MNTNKDFKTLDVTNIHIVGKRTIEDVVVMIKTMLEVKKNLLDTHHIIIIINNQTFRYYNTSEDNRLCLKKYVLDHKKTLDMPFYFNNDEVVDEVYTLEK